MSSPFSEGVRWFDEKTGKVGVIYSSSEVDEYGHSRLEGSAGSSHPEIQLGIEARAQISRGTLLMLRTLPEIHALPPSELPLATCCRLLIREDYGQMPVLKKIVPFMAMEEFNTTFGLIREPLEIKPSGIQRWYNIENLTFYMLRYKYFLRNILEQPNIEDFNNHFPQRNRIMGGPGTDEFL